MTFAIDTSQTSRSPPSPPPPEDAQRHSGEPSTAHRGLRSIAVPPADRSSRPKAPTTPRLKRRFGVLRRGHLAWRGERQPVQERDPRRSRAGCGSARSWSIRACDGQRRTGRRSSRRPRFGVRTLREELQERRSFSRDLQRQLGPFEFGLETGVRRRSYSNSTCSPVRFPGRVFEPRPATGAWSRCLRHSERCDEYKPSRRTSAPR